MYSERQNQIIELLRDGSMSIPNIAKELFVSEMTVRRDIAYLTKIGVTSKFRGGVALKVHKSFQSFEVRAVSEKDDKMRLAREAVSHIRDGMLIFIDNSTTCYYIVPLLSSFRNLMVVTNSVKVLAELGEMGIKVKMACGNYYYKDKCVVGSETEAYIKDYRYDVAFLSATGYDDRIIMTYSEANANVRRVVIGCAAKSIFLMVPSKKKRLSKFVICKTKDIDLIT